MHPRMYEYVCVFAMCVSEQMSNNAQLLQTEITEQCHWHIEPFVRLVLVDILFNSGHQPTAQFWPPTIQHKHGTLSGPQPNTQQDPPTV